ncbi:hypothetical protein BpHYR1_029278 [Brachionus plicatilis]|uniref:Uncharacterized protein n=1 Tax=Brachionus plicatilis TaxID=10195 RepID=A0A3M7PWX4_BRAPC|nr:hypothetical protein BpHYR1_029278 [Brachionus plicatilis]
MKCLFIKFWILDQTADYILAYYWIDFWIIVGKFVRLDVSKATFVLKEILFLHFGGILKLMINSKYHFNSKRTFAKENLIDLVVQRKGKESFNFSLFFQLIQQIISEHQHESSAGFDAIQSLRQLKK